MASRAHQFIVDLLAQRMSLEGYEIVSHEGTSEFETGLKMLPPTIRRHRPDLIGLKKEHLVIGEAKTANDISIRTKEQIEDYISASQSSDATVIETYIGVPLSIKEKVQDIVNSIPGGNSIFIFAVPDRLLPPDHE